MGKDAAPIIVAKGDGFMAEKIIALAQEHHIHLRENKNLVELLAKAELNTEIPFEAFTAVAEIIVYLYKIQGKLKK
jgi:flagellar biosynthesis protein